MAKAAHETQTEMIKAAQPRKGAAKRAAFLDLRMRASG
jgi:hypothetical protein